MSGVDLKESESLCLQICHWTSKCLLAPTWTIAPSRVLLQWWQSSHLLSSSPSQVLPSAALTSRCALSNTIHVPSTTNAMPSIQIGFPASTPELCQALPTVPAFIGSRREEKLQLSWFVSWSFRKPKTYCSLIWFCLLEAFVAVRCSLHVYPLLWGAFLFLGIAQNKQGWLNRDVLTV